MSAVHIFDGVFLTEAIDTLLLLELIPRVSEVTGKTKGDEEQIRHLDFTGCTCESD